ncbi:unnamed protein product [Rotaria sp. Silwood2]|nr:unnamed protein product [Rotaria sp. Silwood2]CAF3382937.1 unnamed protein product [Rotaria sp. Silwood2]
MMRRIKEELLQHAQQLKKLDFHLKRPDNVCVAQEIVERIEPMNNQREPDESDDSDGSERIASEVEVDGAANPRILNTNQIFIAGLSSTMPEKLLFDVLWDIFSTVGEIKINRRTRKPMIYLFKQKDKMSQLTGNAMVTFNEEESAIKAIEKYNEKRISILNNARILVKPSKKMCTRSEILPTSTPTLRSGPVPQEYPGKGKGKQRKPNASDDLDGSESTDSEIEVDGGANPRILNTNQIFITGLPSTMSEKLLFDTLWDIFSTVGEIKVTKKKIL